MLEMKYVSVRYRNSAINVLQDVSLHVGDHEVVSIVGANGAGKSTIINTISGILKPVSGELVFNGEKLPSDAAKVTKKGIVQIPEGRHVFPSMTVRDNLLMGAYLTPRKSVPDLLEEVFTLFPRLRERKNQQAGTLSGGEQQMLAIGRGLMGQPKLLLLDEPSLGLAPIVYKEIFRYLKMLNQEKGLPLLIVEQNAQMAFSVSDRAYVLELGKMVLDGPSEEIRNNEFVKKAYLGG